MEAHAPGGISSLTDQAYRSRDGDGRLDVYFPETVGPDERLPTVVWTHGGAWISGHKDDATPYFQLIAAEGYAVVSVGYSVAPGATYPTPIHQVNDALAYMQENAAPPDHEPGLAHGYQFDLDNADGQNALAQMLRFLKQYGSPQAPTRGAIGS